MRFFTDYQTASLGALVCIKLCIAQRQQKSARRRLFAFTLAETEGFEPSMRLYTPYSLSRGAPSATRSRFQSGLIIAQA